MSFQRENINDLINNFEKIPSRDEYTSALVSKINPDLARYYRRREIGWHEFRDDVIFLLEHLDIPLRYVGHREGIVSGEPQVVCLLWTRVDTPSRFPASSQVPTGERYSIFIARDDEATVEHWLYDTLEAAISTLLVEILAMRADVNHNPVVEMTDIDDENRLVLDFMHLRNVDRVDEVITNISGDGYINIVKPLVNLSIDPLSSAMDAAVTLVKDGLVVIGLQGYEVILEPEEEEEYVDEMEPAYVTTPFIVKYSLNDAPLVLTSLFYTPNSYVTLRFA